MVGWLDITWCHVVSGQPFVIPDPEMGYEICVILKECCKCKLPELLIFAGKVLKWSFSILVYLLVMCLLFGGKSWVIKCEVAASFGEI